MAGLNVGQRLTRSARASDDANMKVVNSFAMDVINAHDVTAVDRLFAADYREHTPMGTNTGTDAFKGFASAILAPFQTCR